MSEYPRQRINKYTIESATGHANGYVNSMKSSVANFDNDPERDKRLSESRCVVCFYERFAAHATACSRQCGLCDEKLSVGNSRVPVLCVACATKNGLCAMCGGDMELKHRRKPRAYETDSPDGATP